MNKKDLAAAVVAATLATTGVNADMDKAVENNILPPEISERAKLIQPERAKLIQPEEPVEPVAELEPSEQIPLRKEFVEYIQKVENDSLRLGDTKNLRHESAEGGTDTIGFGHKLTVQEIKDNKVYGYSLDNLTPEIAKKILMKDLKQTEKTLTNNYGEKYLNLDDRIEKEMLMDFQFNVRNFSEAATFKNFKKALFSDDEEGMKEEYERYFKDKEGTWQTLARNKDFFNYFFVDK